MVKVRTDMRMLGAQIYIKVNTCYLISVPTFTAYDQTVSQNEHHKFRKFTYISNNFSSEDLPIKIWRMLGTQIHIDISLHKISSETMES